MKPKKVLTPEEKAELVRHSRHRHLATDLMLMLCSALFVVLFCYLETHLPAGIHIGHRYITAEQLALGIHSGTGLAGLTFGGAVTKSYCYHLHTLRKTRTKESHKKEKLTKEQKIVIKAIQRSKELEDAKAANDRLLHQLKEKYKGLEVEV